MIAGIFRLPSSVFGLPTLQHMEYIGEHLLPGQLGRFAIVLSFVASLLAVVAYSFATNKREDESFTSWRKIGRISFTIHGLSVFFVIATIFYLMVNQYYEYQYVQAHVSEDLDFKYIFSAFWEGQEGSFLLWMFWHVVLGFILMRSSKEWEAPVIAVFASVQLFIGSMILGLYVPFMDDFRIGVNPLLLLRDTMSAPIFAQADYVKLISGNGLNPLLQNYWMTIHPPTLFLGFASTVVPFAYAVAGLWTKKHKEWLKPAMPWALFSGAILGLGILMGGAWAYEALTFGGYWAWDPVENMSLVPWIILIAGIHSNLVARNTGYSIKTAYLFYLLSFVLIVYSTFLTRSGVLGETSVHAFTEMGLEAQLIAFLGFYFFGPLYLFFKNYKNIPSPKKEEATASKEFWIFIGSLVLFFSAILISWSTSLPVYNKIRQIFEPEFMGHVITNPIEHYNKYQIWIAIFVGLLSGASQFLRFREFNWSKHKAKFLKHFGIAFGLSLVLTFAMILWIEANAWQYKVLLFCSLFTIISNLDYLVSFMKMNLKAAGATFAHMGFGLMVIGAMASGLNKEFISTNPFAQRGLIEGFSEDQYKRNVLLMKDSPLLMSGYEVTYQSDTIVKFVRTFKVNYKKKDKNGETVEEFNLYPNVLYDKGFTKIAASNPSTKRYLGKDVFTHVSSLPQAEMDIEFAKAQEDSLNYNQYELFVGDSVGVKDYRVSLISVDRSPTHSEYDAQERDLAIGLNLLFEDTKSDFRHNAMPMVVVRDNVLFGFAEEISELNCKVRLSGETVTRLLGDDSNLNFETFTLKKGEGFNFNGNEVTFKGFNPKVSHPDYVKQEGDIAVSALLDVTSKDGQNYPTAPVYLIRGNQPYNLKSDIAPLGLQFRFASIDPKNETVDLMVAVKDQQEMKLPFEIADDVPRTDFIVLEAIVFPGINLFWLGSLMMLGGLAISMFYRRRKKSEVPVYELEEESYA